MDRRPGTVEAESTAENMKPFMKLLLPGLLVIVAMESSRREGPGWLSVTTISILAACLLLATYVFLARLRMSADVESRRIELRWSFLGLRLPATYVGFDEVEKVYVGWSNPASDVTHGVGKKAGVVPVEIQLAGERSETVFQTRDPAAAETLGRSLSRLLGVEMAYAKVEQAELERRVAGIEAPLELQSHVTREDDELVIAVPAQILQRRTALVGLGIYLGMVALFMAFLVLGFRGKRTDEEIDTLATASAVGLVVVVFIFYLLFHRRFMRPSVMRAKASHLKVLQPGWIRWRITELQGVPRCAVTDQTGWLDRAPMLELTGGDRRVLVGGKVDRQELLWIAGALSRALRGGDAP